MQVAFLAPVTNLYAKVTHAASKAYASNTELTLKGRRSDASSSSSPSSRQPSNFRLLICLPNTPTSLTTHDRPDSISNATDKTSRTTDDTSSTVENSLLGILPPELRNQVYDLLLPDPIDITFDVKQRKTSHVRNQEQRDFLALAQTCKQINGETTGIYYSTQSWNIIVTPFYLGAHSAVTCPPQPRARGLAELKEWLGGLNVNAIHCVSHLHIYLAGNFTFLDEPSATLRALKPSVTWLADRIRQLRVTVGDSVDIMLHVQAPAGILSRGAVRYTEVAAKVGDITLTNKHVNECIEARQASIFRVQKAANGRQQNLYHAMSPAELACCYAREEDLGDRVKWFLRKIAA